MALRIEDYALIGDTHSCALVGRNGSIDWLCWPRFDSDACLAALLGDERHGRFRLAPRGTDACSRRRYRTDSLVLDSDFEHDGGTVRVTDVMPPRTAAPELLRVVEGVRGEVPMRMELAVRFGYGDRGPWLRRHDGGVLALAGPDAVTLECGTPLRIEAGEVVSDFIVRAGQRQAFRLSWHPSHAISGGDPLDPDALLQGACRFWRSWCDRCPYDGPFREAVIRSLLTLKALTYSPTGGIVAAATTSLPERVGGIRNWDYRFCWLRDATFTLLALMNAGYLDEAQAWRDWLVRAVAGEPRELQIAYGLAGEKRIPELPLPWLPGYEGSIPVRIGNAAALQLQLDVFGETMDCLHHTRRNGLPPAADFWPMQCALLEFLEGAWTEPDEGIWEVRGPRQHFTHSKVMAWVAVDRTLRDAARFALDGPLDRWKALRSRIHDEVCRRGFDPACNAFVQAYGGRALDASLLMIPLVGFLPARDGRVQGTLAAVQHRLLRDGFVYRYDTRESEDGLPPGEGAFLACSLWLADNLILLDRRGEALELLERVLAVRNDVGLLSEQYDPHARRQLGNFPQAFSHVAVVNTVLNLSRRGPAEQRGQD
jgi:GH15 family glucan-1,4-alpha-glucosidase